MKFKTILLGSAAFALMAAPAVAQTTTTTTSTTTTTTKHHHHHHAAMHMASGGSSVDARTDELEREIHDLRAQQQANASMPAPSDAVTQAQFESLQNQV